MPDFCFGHMSTKVVWRLSCSVGVPVLKEDVEMVAEHGKLQSSFMLMEHLELFLSTRGAIQIPTPNPGHLAGVICIWASWCNSSLANWDNFALC